MASETTTKALNAARWVWQKAGIGLVIALLIVVFILGYSLGVGPDTTQAKPDEHEGHNHDAPKAEATEWICSMHPQIRKTSPGTCPICGMKLTPATAGAAGEGMRSLTITPSAEKLLDIQTTPVQRMYVEASVSMVGKIDYDETRLGYITAYVGGRLDRLFVDYTGVTVKKGDHMVELYSPELLSAQEELLQAIAAVKSLQDSDVGIVRETAVATVDAAREKLRLWGLTKEQVGAIEKRGKPEDNVVINSPVGGVVIHKNAQEGMYVQTGTRIYTIADLGHLWVKFDAYESDLIWLRYGQPVEFTTEAYPGVTFRGQIAFIDPVLDDVRRTVKVRVNVTNEDGRLKPGMFARGRVKAQIASAGRVVDEALAGKWISPMHPEIIKDKPGLCDKCGMPLVRVEELGYVSPDDQPATKPLVVPASAVLTTGKRAIVYVKVPDAKEPTFEGREIVLGPRAGDYYIVLSNLRQGEEVVTKGNFKLDSELQLRAKPSMMTPDGGGGGGHDHGGHGSQGGHPASHGAAPASNVMDLPPVFIERWQRVEHALAQTLNAAATGDSERIKRRYQQLLLSLQDVSGQTLSAHPSAVWTEMSMRLTNDAVLGYHAKDGAEAREALKSLLRDVSRVRAQMGLKAPHVHGHDAPMPPTLAEAIKPVLDHYLKLSEALAGDDEAKSVAAAKLLAASVTQAQSRLAPESNAHWKKMFEQLVAATSTVADASDLKSRRQAFSPLSNQLQSITLAGQDEIAGPLYEVKCPMAFDNKGATWLQRDREVRNPYFGSQMFRCGDVVGTLVYDEQAMASVMDNVPIASALLSKPQTPVTATALYEVPNLVLFVDNYLKLSDALTAGKLDDAKAQGQKALTTLAALKTVAEEGRAKESWTRSSESLSTALKAITESSDIEVARQSFALLSEELAAVLRAGSGMNVPMYRVKCPMAFDNRGAAWLQSDKKVLNPYFGDRMLRCGSVVETITPRPPVKKEEHQHE